MAYGTKPQPKKIGKGIRVFQPFMSKKVSSQCWIWSVILNGRFSVQRNDQDRGLLYGNKIKGWKGGSGPMNESNR